MRLTIIIILIAVIQLSAKDTRGQMLTYNKKDITLFDLFMEIGKQTGYNIVWSDSQLSSRELIDADFYNTPLEKVLDKLLFGRSVTYQIVGKAVVIKEDNRSLSEKGIGMLVGIEVRGRVFDETNRPLAGATVKVKGTGITTVTNKTGEFYLNKVDEKDVLIISFLGYQTQVVQVSKNILSVKLILSTDKLQEVEINAGYYTVKDRERTGSISRVDAKTIAQQPVSNPLAAMIGRMAGVNIEPTSGVSGAGFRVQIRGVNSLRTDAREPLYLIDGVPYPSSRLTNDNIGISILNNSASPLNYINPADIESIEVLKDADATAIYGSRGANGVVLIKTKRAKIGKTSIDINVYNGISKIDQKLNLLSTEQYLEMRNEAFRNDGLTPGLADYDLNGTWDKNSYTDWQNTLIGGTARNLNIQTSISGGNEFTQFLFRANYGKQTTVFPGDFSDQKRSGALTINHSSLNKKFKINLSSTYAMDHNNLPQTDLTSSIFLAPNAPAVYSVDGNLNWALNSSGSVTWNNPFAAIYTDYNSKSASSISNALLNYEIIPGLFLRSSMGYTSIQLRETLLLPIKSQNPSFLPTGTNYSTYNTIETWIIEPQINYQKSFGKNTIDILLGSSFQKNDRKTDMLAGFGYTSDLLMENISAAPTRTVLSSESQYKYNAVFGRLNYNYKSKYLINLTGRRDGSSRFGPDKQFANFWALGLAWIFTSEGLFKDHLSFLSFGKIRSSYGVTGSDAIPDYGYLNTYTATQPYQGGSGLIPSRIANPDYSWEINKKLEVSLDLGFVNDRILFSASWYRNRSSNQLVGYSLPDITGFSSVQYNLPASVQNTGWEFELKTSNITNKSFSWKSFINLTIPRNRLLAYPNLAGSSNARVYTIGESIFTPIVYHYLGVNSQTGIYTFEDLNNNGNDLDEADKKSASKALTSQLYGGLQNSITFKDFTLDIFCQFALKTVRDPLVFFGAAGTMTNQLQDVMNRWQTPGDETSIQKFSVSTLPGGATQRAGLISSSDRFANAAFLRLKNVSFSWNVPKLLIEKIKLNNLRVYIQGQNLFTITRYPGDPETANLRALPALTTIVAGLQINL